MKSLRGRLGLLLGTFFLLVSISAGLTVWGLQAQAGDALVINLAGRQRMLVQQMTRQAYTLGMGQQARAELAATMTDFEDVLDALQNGGQVDYPPSGAVNVPAAPGAPAQDQLEKVRGLWESYRQSLEAVQSAAPQSAAFDAALAALDAQAPELVAQVDRAVRQVQTHADRQVSRLRTLQAVFFTSALLLLAIGGLVIHRSILAPLKRLGGSARRIGEGDLMTPVEVSGPQEVRLLAGTFEGMRAQLAGSQAELVGWGERLEERVQQRTRELEALYDVSREISSRLELENVLRSVTDKARDLLGAEVALLCLLEAGRPVLSLRAGSGADGLVRSFNSPAGNPFVTEILADHSARLSEARVCQGSCGILDDAYRASHLAAPLWAGQRVIGALCVGSRQPGLFSDDSPVLLTRLANAAAVAIENARLYNQAERAAALEERQRIAAQMHDGLAQMVNYLGLQVDQATERLEAGEPGQAGEILNRVRDGLDGASAEVRRSIASLQDELPPAKDLQARLADLVRAFAGEETGPVEWATELDGSLFLLEDDAQQVLGVAQEALQNARRYSGANRICLRLAASEGQAALTVEDNGEGFDPEVAPPDGRRHFGLSILRARAARLGGSLEILSAPGAGARVTLAWPIRRALVPAQQLK